MDLVNVMKALGDETRLRMLNLLNKKELCVCEIEELLDINQSNASRHLNKLSSAGLVEYRKSALYVYYKIKDEAREQFPFLVSFLMDETRKLTKCLLDEERLNQYIDSGITCDELKDGRLCFKDNKEVQ